MNALVGNAPWQTVQICRSGKGTAPIRRCYRDTDHIPSLSQSRIGSQRRQRQDGHGLDLPQPHDFNIRQSTWQQKSHSSFEPCDR